MRRYHTIQISINKEVKPLQGDFRCEYLISTLSCSNLVISSLKPSRLVSPGSIQQMLNQQPFGPLMVGMLKISLGKTSMATLLESLKPSAGLSKRP